MAALPYGSLDGRTAVVTGSSSGIGRAIALELAAAGADVVVHCARSIDQADQVVETIKQIGRRAARVVGRLDTSQGRADLIGDVSRICAETPDIWISNAGADVLTGDAAQLSYAEKLERLLAVDVCGTVELGRAIGSAMKSRGRGVILNIGWDQAATGMEGESGELFAAAKNAIMGFTRSLSLSLAPEVRVNCIAPGWIRTAWGESASETWQRRVIRETPLQRWGEPEDIARLARFLVSDDAAYLTGQVINANGGAVR